MIKAILKEDIIVIDIQSIDGLQQTVEVILKEGTEIMVDPDALIGCTSTISFTLLASEYSYIN